MSSFNEAITIDSYQAGVGTVGTSAAKLAGARDAKVHKRIIVKNTHATNNLFVGKEGVTATVGGYELGPDEEVYLDLDNPSKVFVVASGASTTYTWCAH